MSTRVTSARISLRHMPSIHFLSTINASVTVNNKSSAPNNGFPLQGNSVGPRPPCLIVGRPHCFPSYFKVVFFPSSSNNTRMNKIIAGKAGNSSKPVHFNEMLPSSLAVGIRVFSLVSFNKNLKATQLTCPPWPGELLLAVCFPHGCFP